jgi:hypothetical protein
MQMENFRGLYRKNAPFAHLFLLCSKCLHLTYVFKGLKPNLPLIIILNTLEKRWQGIKNYSSLNLKGAYALHQKQALKH